MESSWGWSLRFGRAGFRVYQADLAFDGRAEGGVIAARLGFTNGLRVDGVRGGLEVVERGHATLAAENGEDEKGRLWDIVWMLRCAARATSTTRSPQSP